MTPIKHCFSLRENKLLTKVLLGKIRNSGHSRIPVFNEKKEKVVGILYTKDLVGFDPCKKSRIKDFMHRDVYSISKDALLDTIFYSFKIRKVHLFIVHDEHQNIVGIVTLEDVLEEIVGEIVDEHDTFVDMRKLTKKRKKS